MNPLNHDVLRNVTQPAPEGVEKGSVRIDGYEQVLAMLRVADNDFRESLLRRLAQRDPKLVAKLRAHLRM